MSIGSDKDWLRSIGVSTAAERNLDPVDLDDDEADHELPAAPTPTPPSAAADPEDGAPTIGDSSEPAGARPDQGEPAPADVADRAGVAANGEAAPGNSDDSGNDPERRSWRFNPWVAAVSLGAVAACTLVTWGVTVLTSTPAPPPSRPQAAARMPVQQVPPPPTGANPASADAPIPFTASADCPVGSTSANSLSDPQALAPWICVRPVDGQVVHIDLGRDYVITAVAIVPGAVKPGPGDQGDPWLLHRVVSRLQWGFNDLQQTTKPQDTGNKRGEVVMAIPSVHASAITVTIQQTSRPPVAAPTPTAPAGAPGGGMLGSILGSPNSDNPPPATTANSDPDSQDPSGGTFAVSSIKIIGHRAS